MNKHDTIIDLVATHRGISWIDMKGHCRKRQFVRARQLAMWLIRMTSSDSYPHIGESFQGRDHTTVMHAIRVVDGLVVTSPEWRMEAQMLLAKLQRKAAA